MPQLESRYFGTVEYEPDSVFDFPAGLPGFETEKQFLFVEQAANRPLVFLQSVVTPVLCFLAVAAHVVAPEYRLQLSAEDLAELDLPTDRQPEIGPDLLCLLLLSVEEGAAPTANLLSPVVVNLRLRRGLQAVQAGSGYSHRHPLPDGGTEAPCS
ncbi:MAG: flagellar assembly protein FliW [Bryobacterales bacterium]|jgi:flagellar assembly factor FliW|nr:flagellar assembly protein FliW [Bryobacterales bacterium]